MAATEMLNGNAFSMPFRLTAMFHSLCLWMHVCVCVCTCVVAYRIISISGHSSFLFTHFTSPSIPVGASTASASVCLFWNLLHIHTVAAGFTTSHFIYSKAVEVAEPRTPLQDTFSNKHCDGQSKGRQSLSNVDANVSRQWQCKLARFARLDCRLKLACRCMSLHVGMLNRLRF